MNYSYRMLFVQVNKLKSLVRRPPPGLSRANEALKLSSDDIQQLSLERTRSIIDFAFENVPLYRERFARTGFTKGAIREWKDLECLPVLRKEDLREGYETGSIFAMDKPRDFRQTCTTGSTGEPLTMYFDDEALKMRSNNLTRLWRILELDGSRPYAVLWRKKKLSDRDSVLQKRGMFMHISVIDVNNAATSGIDDSRMRDIISELKSFNPKVIRGYVSALDLLANYMIENGIKLRLSRLVTSAEYLSEPTWQKLERAFGCPVHNLYGGTEAPGIAVNLDEHHRLHIMDDFYRVEVVDEDNRSVDIGNNGRILVTDYFLRGAPLIRYEIGDIGQLGPNAANGYPFRTFDEIQGRTNDIFILPDGRCISSHIWHIYFREMMHHLHRFRVIQRKPDQIEIFLLPRDKVVLQDSLQDVKKKISKSLGPDVAVTWNVVNDLPLDPSEKFRAVRSEVRMRGIMPTPALVRNDSIQSVPKPVPQIMTIVPYANSARFNDDIFCEDILKLDWNEASVTPSNAVRKALLEYVNKTNFHIYPDVDNQKLRQAIAEYCGVNMQMVQYFSGSDAALEYVARIYLQRGDKVAIVSPTYDNFRIFADSCGAEVIPIYGPNPFHTAVVSIMNISFVPRMIYIVNPNNPTGVYYDTSQLSSILSRFPDTLVICDEAYYEFTGESVIELLNTHCNLLISRSLSKAFGLAALRIGYLVAHSEIIGYVDRIRVGKNVSAMAQVATLAALEDLDSMRLYVAEVMEIKGRLVQTLLDWGVIVRDTPCNYIMVKCKRPDEFVRGMKREKVFVRDRSKMHQLAGYVRITVAGQNTLEPLLKAIQDNLHYVLR